MRADLAELNEANVSCKTDKSDLFFYIAMTLCTFSLLLLLAHHDKHCHCHMQESSCDTNPHRLRANSASRTRNQDTEFTHSPVLN
jgi:hypothetical protein